MYLVVYVEICSLMVFSSLSYIIVALWWPILGPKQVAA